MGGHWATVWGLTKMPLFMSLRSTIYSAWYALPSTILVKYIMFSTEDVSCKFVFLVYETVSYRSWQVLALRIAGVTNFPMISGSDYYTVKNFGHIRYLVEFVNLLRVAVCRAAKVALTVLKRLVLLYDVQGPVKSWKTCHKRSWKVPENHRNCIWTLMRWHAVVLRFMDQFWCSFRLSFTDALQSSDFRR